VLRKIAKTYQDIYEEEERTTTLPVETTANRFPGCHLINRAETDGTYDIHSHPLADLLLYTMSYDPSTAVMQLQIDS